MARAATKAGKGTCPNCAADVWFRTSAGGMLKYKCESCDSTGYAEPGGRAFRKWSAGLTEQPGADDQPAPAPAPAPAPRKTATQSSAFSIGNL